MAKPKIQKESAVDAMIEFVKKYLQPYDSFKGPSYQGATSLVFAGTGEDGNNYALEVVIQGDRAAGKNFGTKRVKDRSKAFRRNERTYTGILFPRGIDYSSSTVDFKSPYLNQADLLQTASLDEGLLQMYNDFSHYNVKKLKPVESDFAIPLTGNKVAYYNVQKNLMQVVEFQRFPVNEVIPANVPLDISAFWGYARRGKMPDFHDPTSSARYFRKAQKTLHDEVRKIIRTETIKGDFTLNPYGKAGARLINVN